MKYWELARMLMMRTWKNPTGNLHWSFTQTKTMPLEPQKPSKVIIPLPVRQTAPIKTVPCKCTTPLWAALWHAFVPVLFHPEIGNAYAVLSNPDKRKQYDVTGGEEPSSPGQGHGNFNFQHGGFEADITPEDLFNMFFGGGFTCEWLSLNLVSYQTFCEVL